MGAAASLHARRGYADCHFHVIGPQDRFPMEATRSYTPDEAPLARWREALGPLGFTHGVVVQPSFYGTDNRALLVALDEGDGRLVGVAALAADATDAQLRALVDAGVRGLRMAHFEAGDPRAMGGFVPFASFEALEDRMLAFGLHLQLFTDSRLLPAIAQRLRRAKVPVVIDHMGRTPASLGTRHAGHAALCELLADDCVWVKLSGVANISAAAPTYDDARAIHESLLRANPGRLIWGSDWPHTRASHVAPRTADLFALFCDWTPCAADRDQVLMLNPWKLYRWPPPPWPQDRVQTNDDHEEPQDRWSA